MKLKRFRQKNFKKIGIIIFTLLCIFLITGIFFYTSFANFETYSEFNIIKGKVESNGDIYFVYYVDEQLVFDMPLRNSGYIFDEENSSCTNNAYVTWNYSGWFPEVRDLTQTRTKCTLYFKKTKTVDSVLGKLEVYEYTPDFTKSACDDEFCESHEKGIFETTDTNGVTYYYRGSVENNYFYFANLWWRIIRINGDGTIRLIYDGTSAHDNGESSTDRQIGTSKFNVASNDNMYVGYMYTNGNAHGTETSSIMKTTLETFYDEKLVSYASYIDTNAGFCGDRSTLNNQEGVGTLQETTYYKGYLRIVESTPSLVCENTLDLYTVSSSLEGNKALSKPIGLITVDEVMLAGTGGGVFDGNYNHVPKNPNGYLTTGTVFWTLTPIGGYVLFDFTTWNATLINISASGGIDDDYPTKIRGIRPVINLKSTLPITGNGTKENPYRVS